MIRTGLMQSSTPAAAHLPTAHWHGLGCLDDTYDMWMKFQGALYQTRTTASIFQSSLSSPPEIPPPKPKERGRSSPPNFQNHLSPTVAATVTREPTSFPRQGSHTTVVVVAEKRPPPSHKPPTSSNRTLPPLQLESKSVGSSHSDVYLLIQFPDTGRVLKKTTHSNRAIFGFAFQKKGGEGSGRLAEQ